MISQHPDRQASDGLLIQKTSGGSMKKLLFLIFGLMFTQIGMADTVNIDWLVDGQTYSQTTCTPGDTITPPTAPAKYGYTFREWRVYTPIEYIESTGTQYIDTGVTPNQDTSVLLNGQITSNDTSGIFFGCRTSASQDIYTIQRTARNEWVMGYNAAATPFGTGDTNPHTWYKNKNHQYMDNLLIYTFPYGNFTCKGSGILFGGNFNGTKEATDHHLRVKLCKIYNNDVLVRDFIPVLDPNGVPCMYDKVTQQFFYNIGTGDFIAGPVVSK